MTRKMRSYVKGLILSLCGKPLPLTAKKEPVAYLYNGVRLPKLPEWDKERYPYAFIYGDDLILSDKQAVVDYGSSLTAATAMRYIIRDGNWLHYKTFTQSLVTFGTPDWANYDILNADGTLYLAASKPVPVYE